MKKIIIVIFCFLSFCLFSSSLYASSLMDKNEDKIVMPEFPGGHDELVDYLLRETKFPYDAQLNDESGEVMVEFMVERNGAITGVHVIKSVAPALDTEAVRVVSNMPKWKPGTKNGIVMRTQLSMPINFKLIKEVGKYEDGENTDLKANKKVSKAKARQDKKRKKKETE